MSVRTFGERAGDCEPRIEERRTSLDAGVLVRAEESLELGRVSKNYAIVGWGSKRVLRGTSRSLPSRLLGNDRNLAIASDCVLNLLHDGSHRVRGSLDRGGRALGAVVWLEDWVGSQVVGVHVLFNGVDHLCFQLLLAHTVEA
jgi:hypothetical protein